MKCVHNEQCCADSLYEQQVHVDGQDQGDQEEGRGAEELVHRLVSDHRERAGVVEHVVVPVVLPKPEMYTLKDFQTQT